METRRISKNFSLIAFLVIGGGIISTVALESSIFSGDLFVEDDKTLICVHGWNAASNDFNLLMGRSEMIDYYDNMISIDYYGIRPGVEPEFTGFDLNTPLEIIAEKFKDYLIRMHDEGQINDVIDIICHSMGGVITRYMIKHYYPILKANGIWITHIAEISSPNYGAAIAVLTGLILGSYQYQQLDSLGALIQNLNSGDVTHYSISDGGENADLRYSNYIGASDPLLLSTQAFLVGNDVNNYSPYAGLDHYGPLSDNLVFENLYGELTNRVPKSPQAFSLSVDADIINYDGTFDLSWSKSI